MRAEFVMVDDNTLFVEKTYHKFQLTFWWESRILFKDNKKIS